MTFFPRKHLRLLLLPALLLLTGCAGSAKETADSTENEKLSAVATIFPQYDFRRRAPRSPHAAFPGRRKPLI